jgi:hypothetical protein
MDSVDPDTIEVVISVLENFISKVATPDVEADKESLDRSIFEVVKKYLEVIEDSAKSNPTTKFFLVDPILRPKHSWYDAILDTVKKELKDMLQKIASITFLAPMSFPRPRSNLIRTRFTSPSLPEKYLSKVFWRPLRSPFMLSSSSWETAGPVTPPRPQVSLH